VISFFVVYRSWTSFIIAWRWNVPTIEFGTTVDLCIMSTSSTRVCTWFQL